MRKKLGSVLNSVAEGHEPVTITRANKPLAVIISAEEYQDKVLKGPGEEAQGTVRANGCVEEGAPERDGTIRRRSGSPGSTGAQMIVLDASVVLTGIFDDEAGGDRAARLKDAYVAGHEISAVPDLLFL